MISPLPLSARVRLLALHPVAWLVAASFALALIYALTGSSLREAGVAIDLVALLKASSIDLLAVLAAIARAPRLIVWALVFGAGGDALLARGAPQAFMAGAFAFALGHVCYIRAFLRDGGLRKAIAQPFRLAAMAALVGAAVASTLALVPLASPLFGPLALYTAVLTAMAIASFTLPAARWPTMAGAVLFFISDGFVAANLFHPLDDPALAFWRGFAGWMLYWAGQAGLCLGMLRLHRGT